MAEFSAAVERRKPKKSQARRESSDGAWGSILAKIDENPYSWERSVQMLFRTFDRDGSGEVDRTEFSAAMAQMNAAFNLRLSDGEVNAMFKQADVNNGGSIDYAEFVRGFAGAG